MPDPTPYDDPLKVAKREARDLRRHLRELTATVTAVLSALDLVMQGPSTPERGRRIAALVGQLELANDTAKHFGLALEFDDPAFKDPMLPKRRKRKGRGPTRPGPRVP